MGTLVMRLSAPLQSWGVKGRFSERTTNTYPTKSGVIGLLAASLGRQREEDISDLALLKIGVRIDQPGTLLRDFQTAMPRKYSTQDVRFMPYGNPYVSNRYYLEDAIFVVGVEMPDEMLDSMSYALEHPAFPLFLGRRACPPASKVLLNAIPGEELMSALRKTPWQGSTRAYHLGTLREAERPDNRISLVVMRDEIDAKVDAALPREQVSDYPISFSPKHRQFAWRVVVHDSVVVSNPHAKQDCLPEYSKNHDPMAAVQQAMNP